MWLDIPTSLLLPAAGEPHGSETAEDRTYLGRAGSDPLGAVVRSGSRFQGVSSSESERGGVPSQVVELLLG